MIIQSIKPVSLPCNQLNTTNVQINGTLWRVTNIDELIQDIEFLRSSNFCHPTNQPKANLLINLTRVVPGHTDLMKNDIYYDTYCIGINTIFASLFPFIALMFFNVSIALKLRYGKKVTYKLSYWTQ